MHVKCQPRLKRKYEKQEKETNASKREWNFVIIPVVQDHYGH